MSIVDLAPIPADIAAEAAQVPGIGVRLISFLRAEIAQNQKRLRQHSQEARELVQEAQAEAEKLKAAGITREVAMENFEKSYAAVLKQL
jgi:glutamyl-tRNA reductase